MEFVLIHAKSNKTYIFNKIHVQINVVEIMLYQYLHLINVVKSVYII